jgi:hypothetical protein
LRCSGGERLLVLSSKVLSSTAHARMSDWDEGGALGFLLKGRGCLRDMVRAEELSWKSVLVSVLVGLGEAGTVPSCCPCSGRGVEEDEPGCPVNTAGAGEGRTECLFGGSVGRSPLAAVADRPSPVPITLLTPIPSFNSADIPTAHERS